MGSGTRAHGDIRREHTNDSDFVVGIESLDDVGFFTVGIVACFAVDPVGEVLIGFDGNQVGEAVLF